MIGHGGAEARSGQAASKAGKKNGSSVASDVRRRISAGSRGRPRPRVHTQSHDGTPLARLVAIDVSRWMFGVNRSTRTANHVSISLGPLPLDAGTSWTKSFRNIQCPRVHTHSYISASARAGSHQLSSIRCTQPSLRVSVANLRLLRLTLFSFSRARGVFLRGGIAE